LDSQIPTIEITSPILIIAFNRPDHVIGLLDLLRPLKPRRIYFSVDGPREAIPSESSEVEKVRQAINSIDWECELFTRFSEVNLGCKWGPISAINWIFETEERAIILEDDIRPTKTFFPFCEQLLDKYEDDERVFMISGSSFLDGDPQETSYRFSVLTYVWGWATWKRAWLTYSSEFNGWRTEIKLMDLKNYFGCNWIETLILGYLFDQTAKGKLVTWDYQIIYNSIKSNQLSAISNSNLTENVGFGEDSTHTKRRPEFLIPRKPMEFPVSHSAIERNHRADLWILRNAFGLVSYKKYLKNYFFEFFK
jgi:hypothetical protein